MFLTTFAVLHYDVSNKRMHVPDLLCSVSIRHWKGVVTISSLVLCCNKTHFFSTGFHQQCHDPQIPAKALEYYTPWVCSFCKDGIKNPYIANNPFEESKDGGSTLREQEYVSE